MEDDRFCLDGTKRIGVDRFYFCQKKKRKKTKRKGPFPYREGG